eukprot:GHVN01000097.1.p1 GENE.GHVN01000097.1~~GHVN01000097.1.p1  ORF type:complete len:168 (-),score=15.69 GHVN01000097.1:432-935(-)
MLLTSLTLEAPMKKKNQLVNPVLGKNPNNTKSQPPMSGGERTGTKNKNNPYHRSASGILYFLRPSLSRTRQIRTLLWVMSTSVTNKTQTTRSNTTEDRVHNSLAHTLHLNPTPLLQTTRSPPGINHIVNAFNSLGKCTKPSKNNHRLKYINMDVPAFHIPHRQLEWN